MTALSRMRHRLPGIERPVFVIAPPRSGSTLLFESLLQFDELTGLSHREAEPVWWWTLPYARRRDLSDAVMLAELNRLRRSELRALLYAFAVAGDSRTWPGRIGSLLRAGTIRYVDKTISNCFHLDVIASMFPDATFIYLIREPRANIASMIDGWPELKRFGKEALTPYIPPAGSSVPHWTFPAPPGWRSVLDRPLPEICAWSWQQHVQAMMDFRDRQGGGIVVRYEDLVTHPLETTDKLAQELDLRITDRVKAYVQNPPLSRTTISPPSPRKWKDSHGQEIAEVLPLIRPTVASLGYDV